jgi:hypothetical protein
MRLKILVAILLLVIGAAGAHLVHERLNRGYGPEDPTVLLRRLVAGGAQIDVAAASERFAPEVETTFRIGWVNPIVARRYATTAIAQRAGKNRANSLVDGNWVFVSEYTDYHRPFEGIALVRKALGLPRDRGGEQRSLEDAVRMLGEIFAAETQMQGGGYIDQDHDHVGEYGFLSEMSGGPVRGGNVGAGLLRLLHYDGFTEPVSGFGGYLWAVFLPDGKGGWTSSPQTDPVPAAGFVYTAPADFIAMNARERYFVCFAWPGAGDVGTMLALTPDGKVRQAPFVGKAPTPADVWAKGDPVTPPTWTVYPAPSP